MKGISAGVRVAILFILLFVGGYIVFSSLGQDKAGKHAPQYFARFRDASGLPKGSKVLVAGIREGEVTDLIVDGRYARVELKLSEDIKVWKSGFVAKKASSLLGENYLEVDPGGEEMIGPDGQ